MTLPMLLTVPPVTVPVNVVSFVAELVAQVAVPEPWFTAPELLLFDQSRWSPVSLFWFELSELSELSD